MALWLLLVACILDRTGQSGTSRYQQELMEVSQRVSSLELRADNAEMRVSQLEEVTRARGHDEILQLENLDEIRGELARVRGDLEVLGHENEQAVEAKQAREEDVIFRLEWLESRATALEETLGVEPAATMAGVIPTEAGSESA
ncbi:MAG: hypothetical protein QGG40_09990, partial [Myxococcota bacterium]|nr:hypothetical protein [Myxococcota bacterium]